MQRHELHFNIIVATSIMVNPFTYTSCVSGHPYSSWSGFKFSWHHLDFVTYTRSCLLSCGRVKGEVKGTSFILMGAAEAIRNPTRFFEKSTG